MPIPAITKRTAIPTITQTPTGVLDALAPWGVGFIPFEAFGKDFDISPLFHLNSADIAKQFGAAAQGTIA
jgi:hypothetical protein